MIFKSIFKSWDLKIWKMYVLYRVCVMSDQRDVLVGAIFNEILYPVLITVGRLTFPLQSGSTEIRSSREMNT